ncbi:protein FAR1-RELATED SEQUENCE 5-like [Arachis stenosperma]|uniref:protein FAR1-RELATED SEQUENCE 5-like n=1 Tax=Arachis stenosperma TaxID=217475 RepID=UPI0025AC66E0|nr:protein FAR1-RELATED SEQUENCE 5-like [Arachis stenosperma]
MGFDVRQLYANKCKLDNSVSSFRLVCAKKGQRKPDKRDHLTKQPRAETRTSCQVRMSLKFARDIKKYVICDLELNHNHILQIPETSHMMPSQRKISEVQALQIDLADEAGIRPKKTHELTSLQAGGKDVLGYTKQDQKNYLRSKRKRDLAYGEAAHMQKKPKTIFTDQDPAMASALVEKLPETYHGLCVWHIMQNAIRHLGNKLKDGSFILRDFKACMYNSEDQFQFQETWDALLQRYKVEDNSWLKSIYKVKEKWAHCYMKKVYTIGMRSTQLSESFNSDLKDFMRSNLDIIHFLKQFERAVGGKRYKELQAEYNARQKLPRLKMIHSPLLKHAAQVYTPNAFDLFQNEFDWSSAAYIVSRTENNQMSEYQVAIFDKDGEYTVSGNQIRTQMIVQSDTRADATARYKNICFKAIKLAARSSDFEVTSNFVEQVIEEAYKKAEIFTSNIENQTILPLQSWNQVTTPNGVKLQHQI